ncbi:nitroreductase [Atopobium fossor]|uniref:nitroreductase n=1 Tax=Atopobium fossor TaxID=39487 RepID=UPI0003F6C27A|nr:nitroreductase [Atopobium fossor]
MNDVIKALKERRSIRSFKSEMPSKEDIKQIIEAGLYAASGKGQQAAIILAVTNKELRTKLSQINCTIGGFKEGMDPFYGAPVILIVLANKNWPTHVYDGSLVMDNMMLAAHSLGLGSIWIHRAKETFEKSEYQQLLKDLGVEGEWEGIGNCAIGYIDGGIPRAVARKDNRVFWVE